MIGKYPAKLDEKNRLFVPAKLRGELGEEFYVTLGVNCGHRCLTIYTAEDWQTLNENYPEAKLLLQVHDELILEAPEAEAEEAAELLRSCMEGVMRLEVPLKTDITTGGDWRACK